MEEACIVRCRAPRTVILAEMRSEYHIFQGRNVWHIDPRRRTRTDLGIVSYFTSSRGVGAVQCSRS
jgi:hypothetical protein